VAEAIDSLLAISLDVSVTLRIAELQYSGGPSDEDILWLANYRDSREISTSADELIFRGPTAGKAAALFNNFARALSLLAFQPGGIRFAGSRYVAYSAIRRDVPPVREEVSRG
jgi:hypothetical protein